MKYIKNGLDRIKMYIHGKKIESFIKTLLTKVNVYGNLIVAIATVTLAVITWSYIKEAKEMRLETKRLADISVEQFKIRAYPAFVISPKIRLYCLRLSFPVFKQLEYESVLSVMLSIPASISFSFGRNSRMPA